MREEFEKYWKDKFENFEIKPNSNLWNKLNNSLFEKQVQLLFKTYFVVPSNNVWRKIHFSLWWKEFTKFYTTSFNIYYLLFSIFSAIGIIFYLYQYEYKNNISEKVIKQSKQHLNNTRTMASVLDNNNYKNLFSDIHRVNENEKKITKEKNQNQPIHFISYSDFVEKIEPMNSSLILIDDKNLTPLTERNESYNFSNNIHSLSFYFSYISLKHILSIRQSETFNEIPLLKFLNATSYGLSAWYVYQYNNLSLSSGILFQSVKQNYAFNNPLIYNDTIQTTEIIDNSYYQYSYNQILYLDTLLLIGDTLWITHIDSTLIVNIDTLFNSELRQVMKNREDKHYFSYKTIELPILFGYTHNFDRFLLTFKAGLSLSNTVIIKGTFPSTSNNYGNMPLVRNQFKWLHLNAICAIEAQYPLTEHLSITMMPMYKQNITNLLKDNSPFILKTSSWFVNVGLKYNIK